MRITRTLTGLAIASAFVALAPLAADAEAGSSDAVAAHTRTWGSYYAPSHAAKALGSLTATGEDHADLPVAATVKISGKVTDLTRKAACGWAVFRITYRDGTNLPFKEQSVRDCSYGSPKPFSLRYRNVYQVELKVCSERKAAKPSLNCLYAGTWKTLYLSK
ncbi:hypothetical protein ABZU32_34690 [Sphaerisporangium sp. NPDC005288]|uniref:hypothetical protein n=1 Tax=Sphaerisporangium sp. NPDC005288 TaxID=3155114 RepID=UPI0033ACA637